jgi:phosphatidylglycerophosphatase A
MRVTVASLLATWFYAGKLRPAPGTWGSLAAIPFALPLAWYGGFWALVAASLAVFALGIWASQAHALSLGRADPGEVVVDEVAGQWLTLAPLCLDWRLWAVGFFAFRVMDVVKPWPCSWCDRHLKGGLGIMLDDLLAGLYAAIVSALLGWWLWDLRCFPWT